MENTLENKAKFFALYCNQRVLIRNINNPQYDDKIILSAYNYDGWLDKSVVELKSLYSISDEDAEYCIGKVECQMRKNDPNHGDYGMSPSAIFVNSLIGDNSYHIGRREADYLRSKGYAVPWMWLSVEQLINYGWIKLKK